jgi:EAL domain-containing protein (putative c-di-GMP-specific phosphodiesterase class I)
MAAETESAGGGEAARPLDWPGRVKEALEGGGLLVLHGQRIVDVRTGATMRHELFLRMVDGHPLIPAAEFVPAAEEAGSIRDVDQWVVGRAIEVAAGGSPVHLNLSLRSIDDEMLELIRERLELTNVDAGDLVLELRERQLVVAPEEQLDFVQAAGEIGCRIALDGFVEGGPDALLLRRLPIDYVKLGSDFIGNLESDPARRRAVSGAALTAHRCGQRVIAHGVKRVTTLQLLADLGVDEAQGYVLGVPEPLDSLLGTPVSAHGPMRLRGVEPPRPEGHRHLKPARLPVPPQPRDCGA